MALTWREVSAPDFSASQRGFESFSNLLGNALGGAQRALTKFDADKSERVNNELALRVMQYTDPEAYKAAVASGALMQGIDPNRVSQENLQLMGERPTTLLRQEQLTGQNAEAAYKFGDLQRDDAASAAAAPIITRMFESAARGDTDGIWAAYNDPASKALIDALDPKDRAELFGKTLDFRSSYGGIRSADQQYEQSDYDFGRRVMTDKDTDEANKLIAELTPRIVDSSDYERIRFQTDELKGVSPRVLLELDRRFLTGGSTSAGGSSSGSPAVGVIAPQGAGREYRGGSAYNAVFGDGQYGLPTKPISEMTIGEANTYGRSSLIPATKGRIGKFDDDGKPLGTSAVGAYQFTQATLEEIAPKVFKGQDWRTVPMTPANQERMAKYLFDQRKGGNLKETWEGLPDARPGAYKDMAWGDVRQLIFRGEVGTDAPPDPLRQTDRVLAGYAQRSGEQPMVAAALDYIKSADDISTTTPMAVSSLVGKDGTLAGGDTGQVTELVEKVSKKYRVSAAVAAVYIRNSLGSPDFMFGDRRIKGTDLGVSWKEMDALDAAEAPGTQRDQAAVVQAANTLMAAEKRLAERRALLARGYKIDISADILAVQQARAAKDAVDTGSMGDPSRTSNPLPPGAGTPIGTSTPGAKRPNRPSAVDDFLEPFVPIGRAFAPVWDVFTKPR
jgi:hypothetical protein